MDGAASTATCCFSLHLSVMFDAGGRERWSDLSNTLCRFCFPVFVWVNTCGQRLVVRPLKHLSVGSAALYSSGLTLVAKDLWSDLTNNLCRFHLLVLVGFDIGGERLEVRPLTHSLSVLLPCTRLG